MVEDPIQNDVDSATLGFANQRLEERQIAEIIVDEAVIGGVVLVV